MSEPKTVSKKGTIGVSGLAVIAGCPEFKTQIVLAVVLIVYMVVQGLLDHFQKATP